ncbi:axoneme-associated protein mst101(1)-like, partial [Homalodisca vitripennis]|uniref:axoneme-associated protein mst101(1)-like n=1 Tax=Homalodisca vitripennis TaxID=197043 RepID=UPI001EEA4888
YYVPELDITGDDGDDQDKTYEPESSESDSSDEEQLANVEPAEIERPRKRKCKEGMWKRNLEYKDRKGCLMQTTRIKLPVKPKRTIPIPALENEGSYSSVCDVSPTVNQSGKINRSLVPYSETESEKDSTSDELTPMKEKKKTRKKTAESEELEENVRKERRQTGRSYTSSC